VEIVSQFFLQIRYRMDWTESAANDNSRVVTAALNNKIKH